MPSSCAGGEDLVAGDRLGPATERQAGCQGCRAFLAAARHDHKELVCSLAYSAITESSPTQRLITMKLRRPNIIRGLIDQE